MEIRKQENIFLLNNGRISYIFSIEKERYLMHRYFGKSIKSYGGSNSPLFIDRGFCSNPIKEDGTFSLDTLPQEYPGMNQGDFRSPAYIIETKDKRRISRFYYKDYEILEGKPPLEGLPSTYTEDDKEALSLCIIMEDAVMQAQIKLYYTIFRDYDAVCRHTEVVNKGKDELYLERLMSMSMDFQGTDYDLITMTGSHMNEKNIHRRPLTGDKIVAESSRGASSPQASPCLILTEKGASEHKGEVWAVNLVYSGDFQGLAEVGQYRSVRLQMGLNPLTFGWNLKGGETFTAPEAVLVYSDEGLNKMSQTFHELYRKRLCRGYWRERQRPVLLNGWEAFTFDVNEENCLSLAKEAAKLGIELFVLDDGWFKNRKDDRRALGDWSVDEKKFPQGLESLIRKICAEGMNFGIWFEPEMISFDSDLYRAHPDWVIQSPDYAPIPGRNQYVLDLSNPQVCRYIVDALSKILQIKGVSYVKWDMNRHMTDLSSFYLKDKDQRELSHRYMLGLYSILESLHEKFPKVLFEGCSSGGGRFDAGMLYYMPQTWTSDNTDAICRLKIQYGTSLLFPPITMGAHVSVSPNLQVGRSCSLKTRFAVAMSGNLGYEMDVRHLPLEEKEEIKRQIVFYKTVRDVVQKGRFYRLCDPGQGNVAAWNFVSEDENTVVYSFFRILADAVFANSPVKLKGLKEESFYRLRGTSVCYGGDELMYAGLSSKLLGGDFMSEIFIFDRITESDL